MWWIILLICCFAFVVYSGRMAFIFSMLLFSSYSVLAGANVQMPSPFVDNVVLLNSVEGGVEKLEFWGLFKENKRVLSEKAQMRMRDLCVYVKSSSYGKVEINGYTDNRENRVGYNLEISRSRVASVKQFLEKNSCLTRAEKVLVSGKGALAPIADNSTAEGRRKNRRIEVILYKK